jgi:hypothetical protein
MRRHLDTTAFRIALSLILAIGIGLARTEKIWAQNLSGLHTGAASLEMPRKQGHEPFDPRRVPQSGGAASRLLAGIIVKHA